MKTKVFFIINTFSLGGGAEAVLRMIINALDDTGRYDIGLMEIIHADIKKEQINNGIKVFPYYTDADAPDRKERMYYVYHEWNKVIDEYVPNDYDIYISFNSMKPSFLLPQNKKSIAWVHGDIYDLINKYPNQTKDMSEERELQREAFRYVDRILAISDITKKSVEDIFPEYKNKIMLFPNGVDVMNVRQKAEESIDILLKGFSIICIGRLDSNKNPIRALNIFHKLLEKKKDAHLYYLGYGILEDEVKKEVERMGIVEHVHLMGYHDNPFPIIKQAQVTLMTSYSEGFPMALLESVSLGIPFVSTVVGGSKMLALDERVGTTFDKDDEAVEEIMWFSRLDRKSVREACGELIKEYDLPKYINRVETVIQEVLKQ